MSIREDLVSSAVTFLQDPSVAGAPEDKRIAFLQSKNLTQEEIDAALARASGASPGQVTVQTNYSPQSQQVIRQPPTAPPQYGYNSYPGYWQQPPPPEIPRRDWRDYFIMATVTGGVGYGLYYIVKRYISPIIAPPTPPQLEQDKAAVDESFNRAFSLIEQLATDTATIKASEEQRSEKLDSALADFERTINELKEASRKRDDDSRRIGDDVRGLQDMIPRAMKTQEKNADDRLKELGQELRSLKTLLNNRVGGSTTSTSRTGANNNVPSSNGQSSTNGTTTPSTTQHDVEPASSEQRQETANPLGRFSMGKGGIPAWQKAAAARSGQTNGNEADSILNSSNSTEGNAESS